MEARDALVPEARGLRVRLFRERTMNDIRSLFQKAAAMMTAAI
jgi:hypothetical protein